MVFSSLCKDPVNRMISQEEFMKIDCIARNPLKERICACFDIKDDTIVDFGRYGLVIHLCHTLHHMQSSHSFQVFTRLVTLQ